MKKRLRPLALQATAAERAEKLGVEIARLQAAIATLDLARLAERRAEAEGASRRRRPTQRARARREDRALVAERERAEEELTDSAGAREQATAALYRLRSGGERHRAAPRVRGIADRVAARASSRRRARYDPSASVELEAAARDAAAAAQAAAAERARLQVEAEERWARVAAIERAAQADARSRARRGARAPRRDGGAAHRRRPRRAARAARRRAAARRAARVGAAAARRAAGRARRGAPASRPARRRPSSAAPPTRPTRPRAPRVREHEDLEARVRLARERLAALEQSLAEREGLPPAARALAEEGEQLALQLLEVEAGHASAPSPRRSAIAPSAVLAADPARALELVEQAQSAGPRLACSCSSAAIRARSSTCPSSRATSCSPRPFRR